MTALERLAEIKARAEAATEGPWEAWVDQFEGAGVTGPDAGRDLVISPPDHNINDGPDAEFIAHARTDVPELVAALEAVLELHKPREVETTRGDCAVQKCEHKKVYDCLIYSYEVCAACDDLALEVDGYYDKEKLALTAYPCPTVQAINNVLDGGK